MDPKETGTVRHLIRLVLAGAAVIAPLGVMLQQTVAGKQYLWVTNAYGDDVHIISVPEHEVVVRIEVGRQLHGIAAPDRSDAVYVAIENFSGPTGEPLWIDPDTREITHHMPIRPKPNQIACPPNGKWAYVPCDDGQFWTIDGLEKKGVTRRRTGGRPHNTQASRDGTRIYLSPMGNPRQVTLVDVTSGHQLIGEIPFSKVVRLTDLSADGTRLYQNIDGLLGFQLADTRTHEVFATARYNISQGLRTTDSGCHRLVIRPDQKEIWSCNIEHRLTHVHDLTTDNFPEIAMLPMIDRIYWLCFSPDNRHA